MQDMINSAIITERDAYDVWFYSPSEVSHRAWFTARNLLCALLVIAEYPDAAGLLARVRYSSRDDILSGLAVRRMIPAGIP